jgi:hypothetical protein
LTRTLSRTAAFSWLLLAGSVSGCWSIKPMADKPYRYDTPVSERLSAFRREGPSGARRHLDEMTDFEWDTVHLFAEGTPYQLIDATVGSPLFGREGTYAEQGALLVFTNAGKVVHAVALVPPFVTGPALTYPRASAILVAYSKAPGPYQLAFDSHGDP